jgi:hypothetical protein
MVHILYHLQHRFNELKVSKAFINDELFHKGQLIFLLFLYIFARLVIFIFFSSLIALDLVSFLKKKVDLVTNG